MANVSEKVASLKNLKSVADYVKGNYYTKQKVDSLIGSPLVAHTASEMTDHGKIYVYTGSETGYSNGHWYYYDGSSWQDGGVYNAIAVDTDKTLSIENKAADAKKTGDELSSLKSDLNAIYGGDANIVEYTDGTVVSHGVTFVKDSLNNTVTASGTISDTYSAKCDLFSFTPTETAVYYISGCPSGGGSSGSTYYFLGLWSSVDDTIYETGDGLFYKLTGGIRYSAFVQAKGQGLDMDGLVFHPFIAKVSEHNIVEFSSETVTSLGVTYVKDGTNKIVSASGSISSGSGSSKCDLFRFTCAETGMYYISGCPSGGGVTVPYYRIGIWDYSASAEYSETGDGLYKILTAGTEYTIYIQAKGNGLNMDGLVFYPSIIKVADYSTGLSLSGLNDEIETIKGKITNTQHQLVSIIDLGGKNDGSADVGAIINANTANTSIYLPAGKYLVTTPIVLINSLIGENSIRQYRLTEVDQAASLLLSGLTTGSVITLGNSNLSVSVCNINIYCNGNENAISLGSNSRLCCLENISISNLGNATGILRSATGSRNLYANNISIFASQFKESTGIEMSGGSDDRLSNIEIMFCQVGIKVLGASVLASNIHIWTGANSYDNFTHDWFVDTVGLLCSGSFYGTNIFIDTSFNFIHTISGKIWIFNFITWDDTVASHYEESLFLVKKEGTGYLRINGGSYRDSRTNISGLSDGEAVNFIGL